MKSAEEAFLRHYCPQEFEDWNHIYGGRDGDPIGRYTYAVSNNEYELESYLEKVCDMDADPEFELEHTGGNIRLISYTSKGIFEFGIQLIKDENLLHEYLLKYDDKSQELAMKNLEKSRNSVTEICQELNNRFKDDFIKKFSKEECSLAEISELSYSYIDEFKSTEIRQQLKLYLDSVIELGCIEGKFLFNFTNTDVLYDNELDVGSRLAEYFEDIYSGDVYGVITQNNMNSKIYGYLNDLWNQKEGEYEVFNDDELGRVLELARDKSFCNPNLQPVFEKLETRDVLLQEDLELFIRELSEEVCEPFLLDFSN